MVHRRQMVTTKTATREQVPKYTAPNTEPTFLVSLHGPGLFPIRCRVSSLTPTKWRGEFPLRRSYALIDHRMIATKEKLRVETGKKYVISKRQRDGHDLQRETTPSRARMKYRGRSSKVRTRRVRDPAAGEDGR